MFNWEIKTEYNYLAFEVCKLIMDCTICDLHANSSARYKYEIKSSSLWCLRHHPDPSPLEGWLILDSNRHLAGPIEFNSAEASSWGSAVCSASKLVKTITNCDRIYLIAFGEGARHLHLHLIPHVHTDELTRSWELADYYRLVLKEPDKAVTPLSVEKMVTKARLSLDLFPL